jgi:hypothetical protein
MKCLRCQGLMLSIGLEDSGNTTNRESFIGWQCLLCGEVIDPGIAANRKAHSEPVKNRARPPGYDTLLDGSGRLKRKQPRH